MRLFLLPISTRRSLIYCEKLHEKAASERSLLDKVTIKANETWAAWEKDDKAIGNWKKTVTVYGNKALKRIPYEEWGLKTIPALTTRRKKAIVEGREKYHVMFPGMYLHQERVPEILKKLAQERQAMHRSKLIWSIVGMPFTAPFMLIPVYVGLDVDAGLRRLRYSGDQADRPQNSQSPLFLPRLPCVLALER